MRNLRSACGHQCKICNKDFDVLLTVHLSIFISVFNQLDAQNLFHSKFYFMPLVYETATYGSDDTKGCVMQF